MSRLWIEVDEEVMAAIGEGAEAFVDSPNDVLRRRLGLQETARPSCALLPLRRAPSYSSGRGSERAQTGELLPMAEYELPLLRALSQLGGSGPRWKVKDAVESMLADRLREADRQRLQNGEERWSNRLGFARLRAVERGHIRSDSQRGIWELAEAGIERLGQLEGEADRQEREAAQ